MTATPLVGGLLRSGVQSLRDRCLTNSESRRGTHAPPPRSRHTVLLLLTTLLTTSPHLYAVSLFRAPSALPPESMLITPQSEAAFNATVRVSRVTLHEFSHHAPLPATGVQTQSWNAKLDFVYTLNGGTTCTQWVGDVRGRSVCIATGETNGYKTFDTEMLSLDLCCPSPLPAVQLRESPSRPSIGGTTLRALPGGHFQVDSFFDVWTEISIDGGSNWQPANTSLATRLTLDPSVLPPVYTPNDLLPPPMDQYKQAREHLVTFGPTAAVSEVCMRLFTPPTPPPANWAERTNTPTCAIRINIITNGGRDIVRLDRPANTTIRIRHSRDADRTRTFDTEMLSMDLSGGPSAPNIAIRESAKRPSLGVTTVTELPGGGYNMDSFFDVWTEISLDSGTTWIPADSPVHVELESHAEPQHLRSTDLPPTDGQFYSTTDTDITFANGVVIRDLKQTSASASAPLPSPGTSSNHNYLASFTFLYSQDGGSNFLSLNAIGGATEHRTGVQHGGTPFVETEMLSMQLQGALPFGPPVQVRESPTRASLGRTSFNPLPGGEFHVDSFFDIWTEVSIDGGGSWHAANTVQPWDLHGVDPRNFILEGIDLLQTPPTRASSIDFDNAPIPADFFGPGSEPFEGKLDLVGAPIAPSTFGGADTIVRRVTDCSVPPGGSAQVPIEIVALNLYCIDPITIVFDGGARTEEWWMRMNLSSFGQPPRGEMILTRDVCGYGGTARGRLPIRPRLYFERNDGGANRVIDSGALYMQELPEVFWTALPPVEIDPDDVPPGQFVDHDANPGTAPWGPLPGTTSNFFLGVSADRCPSNICIDPPLVRLRPVVAASRDLVLRQHLSSSSPTLDTDGDGHTDPFDNSPTRHNRDQADRDGDGVGDLTDNCPHLFNPCQEPCPCEFWRFSNGVAIAVLELPNGSNEMIRLTGEGAAESSVRPSRDAVDRDNDGRDEVCTELLQMELHGQSSLGPVTVRLRDGFGSHGVAEETAGSIPGHFESGPYQGGFAVDSFFDIFYTVELGGVYLHGRHPSYMNYTGGLTPRIGDIYETVQWPPLVYNLELAEGISTNLKFALVLLDTHPPHLEVTKSVTTNGMKIAWPEPSSNRTLRFTRSLADTNWLTVPPPYDTDGTNRCFVTNAPPGAYFFRLDRTIAPRSERD